MPAQPSPMDRRAVDRPLRPLLGVDYPPTDFLPGDRPIVSGQEIIDQSQDAAEEQQEIQKEARIEQREAMLEGSDAPSVRFWWSGRNRIAMILTALAAAFTLALFFFPIAVPQARGQFGISWGIGVILVTIGYLAGFVLADNRPGLARTILVIVAVLQILGGVVSGIEVTDNDIGHGALASLYDVIPAFVALVAAFLIHKVGRSERPSAPEW
ncbi:MAG: hypothetical protein IT305_03620 [Chloroflexi bacterium]|nr:hypothetical protein [Chloroflexota bacterium]